MSHTAHRDENVAGEHTESRRSVKDPVCGMTVDPATAAFRHDYDGQTYFFCGHHCLQRFRAEPAKYLSRKSESLKVQSPQSAIRNLQSSFFFFLPADVIRDAPGSCPICGMAL